MRRRKIEAGRTALRQRGDSMIEVLVTVIVIAIGVLGTAALQITTMKNLKGSQSSGSAIMIAEDLAERMRINPSASLDGRYLHSSKPGTSTNCVSSSCDDQKLAHYDLESWWQQIDASLPSGSGEVVLKTGATNTFVLTVRWDADNNGSTGTNCPIQSSADLECVQIELSIPAV